MNTDVTAAFMLSDDKRRFNTDTYNTYFNSLAQDRYVDAFCGRVPSSVLVRHYSDFSPEVLKEIYEKAGIKILS